MYVYVSGNRRVGMVALFLIRSDGRRRYFGFEKQNDIGGVEARNELEEWDGERRSFWRRLR
jgi:hypothetical protein